MDVETLPDIKYEHLEDMGIKIGCGGDSIQNAINYFRTLLDVFAEKSPVASQYLASDVRVKKICAGLSGAQPMLLPRFDSRRL